MVGFQKVSVSQVVEKGADKVGHPGGETPLADRHETLEIGDPSELKSGVGRFLKGC